MSSKRRVKRSLPAASSAKSGFREGLNRARSPCRNRGWRCRVTPRAASLFLRRTGRLVRRRAGRRISSTCHRRADASEQRLDDSLALSPFRLFISADQRGHAETVTAPPDDIEWHDHEQGHRSRNGEVGSQGEATVSAAGSCPPDLLELSCVIPYALPHGALQKHRFFQ